MGADYLGLATELLPFYQPEQVGCEADFITNRRRNLFALAHAAARYFTTSVCTEDHWT